ncbi:MAG: hypothetical protein AAGB00_03235, partial [Planctomycetota bacterium]
LSVPGFPGERGSPAIETGSACSLNVYPIDLAAERLWLLLSPPIRHGRPPRVRPGAPLVVYRGAEPSNRPAKSRAVYPIGEDAMRMPNRTRRLQAVVAAAALASLGTPPVANAQNGWTVAQTDNRYGNPTAPAALPGGDSRFGTALEPLAKPAPSATRPAPSPMGGQPFGGQPVTPIGASPRQGNNAPVRANPAMAPTAASGPSRVSVSKGTGSLPNDQGQVWREYDIRPYTLRQTTTPNPEQTIVDWVLRETGYEAWHSQPVGLLSASRETLRVYHTPDMQGLVADILDRFVNSQAANHAFSLRIATVRNPNWRAKALPLMSPIPVQSPGVQGWIMPKENAAILLSQLTKRSDWREHSASNQMVLNGQKVLLSTMRPRTYIKGVIRTDNAWPGFQPETGQLEEGATMEFSPLLSLDMRSADAVVKIRIHQVEKMAKVKLDIPTNVTGNQRMEVEVPQMTMANVHERFRWPADHVLVLSLGVVPPPTTTASSTLSKMIPGMNSSPRADGLLMIEARGTAIPSATPGAPGARTALQPGAFSGRY